MFLFFEDAVAPKMLPWQETQAFWIGWIMIGFLGLLALIILFLLLRKTNGIDLTGLISEQTDKGLIASLSRFQLLIFTFLITFTILYLTIMNAPPGFPKIPDQIIGLLGISGGTYVIGKGIGANAKKDIAETTDGALNPPPTGGTSEVTVENKVTKEIKAKPTGDKIKPPPTGEG
jgi:preprotein translocase subunit SecG